MSDSLAEIFLDFYNDPILILEEGKQIKANKMFISHFANLVKIRSQKHHSQMVAELSNPEKLNFD